MQIWRRHYNQLIQEMRYIKSVLMLVSFSSLVLIAEGQCDMFLNESFSSDIIETHLEVTLEKNNDSGKRKAEEDLKVKLRREMSEKILSSVRSQTVMEVSEVNSKFSSYFDSHVDIQSSSNLSYGTFSFCTDEKARKVYGRFTVDKLKLARANYADCLSSIKGLNSEINAVYNSSNNVDASLYKKKLDVLNSHKQTSIYLDPSIDITQFDNYYAQCQNGIALLSQTQIQLHYEEQLGIVSDSLGLERFNFAIRSLRMLQKQYRNDPFIKEELASAEVNYKVKLKRDVLLFESNARYEAALNEIDEYCSLLSCENEIKELKAQLQRAYFDQIFVQLENALEKGLEHEINRFKLQIDKLKDINLKKYIVIQNKCLDYERSKSIDRTESLFHQRDFQGAYNLIKELEKTYGIADSEIIHLKKKVESHILRGMIKAEKQTRPFNYSLQLGTELFSNEVALDSVSGFQMNSAHFGYSAGIYKLYNSKKYEEHNSNRDVKSADFIGLKFTYLDYPSRFVVGLGNSLLPDIVGRYSCLIAIDGITSRFLHYSVGVKYQEMKSIGMNWNKPNEYFGTLGIRIGIKRVNWITDASIRTQFEGKANFQISTGIYYRMDFNRKFGRRDRLACKARLK